MRKVWTSQGGIPANGWASQGDGKCNRDYRLTAEKFEVDSIGLRETGDVVNPIRSKVEIGRAIPCRVLIPKRNRSRDLATDLLEE